MIFDEESSHYEGWRTTVRHNMRWNMAEYSDFDTWDAYHGWTNSKSYREWKANRPVCAYCGEPILEEFEFQFDNGDHVCESCVHDYVADNFRKYIG